MNFISIFFVRMFATLFLRTNLFDLLFLLLINAEYRIQDKAI